MRAPLLAALLLLGACGRSAGDPAGEVSAGEARTLNEAAEMLDGDSVDANAIRNVADEGNSE